LRSRDVTCTFVDADRLVIASHDARADLHVMLRARGAFVRLRAPRGVYRISPGEDIAELCLGLLASVDASGTFDVHALVRDADWERDERAELDARHAQFGWRALLAHEAANAWSRFEPLGRVAADSGPDPQQSVVWDIRHVYLETEDDDSEPDLTRKLLAAIRSCSSASRPWLVFSDFANAVSFDPFQMRDVPYRSAWLYPLLPRDDHPHFTRRTNHACFLSPDFRQGILTYLHEDSLCIFGEELGAAVEALQPVALRARRSRRT